MPSTSDGVGSWLLLDEKLDALRLRSSHTTGHTGPYPPVRQIKPALNESEIFSNDVPDEVLEAAACSGSAGVLALTIAMCTGNAECPF
jgi:hypothetical protein